jgi:hypothetical protein
VCRRLMGAGRGQERVGTGHWSGQERVGGVGAAGLSGLSGCLGRSRSVHAPSTTKNKRLSSNTSHPAQERAQERAQEHALATPPSLGVTAYPPTALLPGSSGRPHRAAHCSPPRVPGGRCAVVCCCC